MRFTFDGEIVVHKKHGDLSTRAVSALFQFQELIDDALVGPEANRVSKESSDRAELAPIRAAAPGLNGDDVKRLPRLPEVVHDPPHQAGNAVELREIEGVPRNSRVLPQIGLALLAECIHRSVHFFQLATSRIGHDPRPGFIGLAQRDRIGMACSAIAPERFVRHFGHMRPAHHYRNASQTKGIRHAIGFGDHPRHGADAD